MAISTRIILSAFTAMITAMLLQTPRTMAAELRPSVTVDDHVIRLGDVVSEAGDAATVVIANAPPPGESDQIAINQIKQVADEFAIDLTVNVAGRSITVHRTGVAVTREALIDRLIQAFPKRSSSDRLDLRLYRNQERLFLPKGFDAANIDVVDLRYQERSRRFSAVISIPHGNGQMREITITGAAEAMVALPVLEKAVEPGEIISRADIGWIEIRRNRLGRNIVTASADLIGQSPRRRLRTGQPLRLTDIDTPVLVEKGSQITMIVQSGNMTLTATGKALEDGGAGDMIRILNNDTHRTVEGLVTDAGAVRIRLNNNPRRDAAALAK